jgi:flagellar assembly factor FliW
METKTLEQHVEQQEQQHSTASASSPDALNVTEANVYEAINFTQPIIGFPGHYRYELVSDDAIAPIQWLRAAEANAVAFPVVSPFVIKQDYDIELRPADVEELGLRSPQEARILCILVLSEDVSQMRVNLRAPIIYNARTHKARQVVLDDPSLPIRYHFAEVITGTC